MSDRGLSSSPRVKAPLAAATDVVGVPARKYVAAVALWRRRPVDRPGDVAGKAPPARLRAYRSRGTGQVAKPPSPVGCLPVPGGGEGRLRCKALRSRKQASPAGAREKRRTHPVSATRVHWTGDIRTPCFGRRRRQGRSAPIRRRQRRRQGVCRSSEMEAPAFAALSRSAREGVGCTVRGTFVVWWSHQLRNTAPTPFLYQCHFPITTKNRVAARDGVNIISFLRRYIVSVLADVAELCAFLFLFTLRWRVGLAFLSL